MSISRVAPGPPRVPADQRLLGLDRRSFPPALFVVGVFLVLTVVVPRINAAIDWNDPVKAGDELALTDTIVFTPVVGWDVEEGFRAGTSERSGEVTIAGDGVTFTVVPDDFDGTPAELLDQIEKVTTRTTDPSFRVDGGRDNLATSAGTAGVVQPYSSLEGDGVVAAFVIDGTGLEVTAYGPPTQMAAATDDIRTMMLSIRATDGDQS